MFESWIGDKFGDVDNAIGGRRLMILGESHYGASPADRDAISNDMTQWVVQGYVDGKRGKWSTFFSKLTRLVLGKEVTAAGVPALWNSLVFYNFVPHCVALEPRVAPTADDFRAGGQPFLAVLERLEIEAVLVCGFRLWNNIPRPERTTVIEENGRATRVNVYGIAGRDVIAAPIKHPSTAFCYEDWRGAASLLLSCSSV